MQRNLKLYKYENLMKTIIIGWKLDMNENAVNFIEQLLYIGYYIGTTKLNFEAFAVN